MEFSLDQFRLQLQLKKKTKKNPISCIFIYALFFYFILNQQVKSQVNKFEIMFLYIKEFYMYIDIFFSPAVFAYIKLN